MHWAQKSLVQVNDVLEKHVSIRVSRTRQEHPARTGMEESAVAALGAVKGRTMTDEIMQYSTYSAARYIALARIPGAIVECGVWRGGCSMLMALGLVSASAVDRELWLFDTFEGMTPPGAQDQFLASGVSADYLLRSSKKVGKTVGDWTYWCVADEVDVIRGMQETGYPLSLIKTIPGPVEETLLGELPSQIAIARLDTDWYSSTKMELDLLFDRISIGGVLILDDYDDWAGAREAVDEFFEERGIAPFLVRAGYGRIYIKCQ